MLNPRSDPSPGHSDIGSPDDAFARNHAQASAQAAARAILEQKATAGSADRGFGSFALYTWGAIACVSAALAFGAILLPDGFDRPGSGLGNGQMADRTVPDGPDEGQLISRNRDLAPPPPVDPLSTASAEQSEILATSRDLASESFPQSRDLGLRIGTSDSVPELRRKLDALRRRAPDLFGGVTPLVDFVEEDSGLSALLIAGPFSSRAQLAQFCRTLKLRLTLECEPAPYRGNPID